MWKNIGVCPDWHELFFNINMEIDAEIMFGDHRFDFFYK